MFEDRRDAGQQLAEQLIKYKDHPIVLALPRGGVTVGFEIAKMLHEPLDVIVARKLGAPHNPELGIGAIAEDDNIVLDEPTVAVLGITEEQIQSIKESELEEMKRRIDLYRNGKPLPKLTNRTVILVDDGLATGVTALAAIEAIKKQKPKQLIFAVPVCAYETAETIRTKVDDFVCIQCPYDLQAIGLYYRNFQQVTDEEVIELLKQSKQTLLKGKPVKENIRQNRCHFT